MKSTSTPETYLKYPGNKAWMKPIIEKLYDPKKRWFDPFCGGLGLPLSLGVQKAFLSDANKHLINLHQWVQKGDRLKLDFEDSREEFVRLVKLYNAARHEELTNWHAEIFYWLCRRSFNGIIRFNRRGEFNAPFGTTANGGFTPIPDPIPFSVKMRGWVFDMGCYSRFVPEPDDFVFLDPPYDRPGSKPSFTAYNGETFTFPQQVELAMWASNLPNEVVLCNHATPRMISLYEGLGFKCEVHDAPRKIAANGDRTAAQEVVAYKRRRK